MLDEDGDPALAMGVPLEGAAVGGDGVSLGIAELEAGGLGGELTGFDEIGFGFLSDGRLGFLPDVGVRGGVEGEGLVGRGVEDGVEVGGDAGGGEGVAEVEEVAVFLGDSKSVGSRILPGVGEGEIEDFEEGMGGGIELHQAVFEDFGEGFLAGEVGDDVLFAMGVRDGEEAEEPDWSGIGERGHGFGLVVGRGEVVEGDAVIGMESAVGGGVGEGSGGVEVAEGVGGEVGIAPDPEETVLEGGDLDGVEAEDAAIEEGAWVGGGATEEVGVAVDALAAESVEAFGGEESLECDAGGLSWVGGEGLAGVTEAVFRFFVAGAGDVKVNGAGHEAGFVEGGPAGAVGDEGDVVDGGEGDHGDATAGGGVDDMDAEGGGGECGGEKEREEGGKEVAHEGSVFGKRG